MSSGIRGSPEILIHFGMLFALHRIPLLCMGIPVHEKLTAITLIAYLHLLLQRRLGIPMQKLCFDPKVQAQVSMTGQMLGDVTRL